MLLAFVIACGPSSAQIKSAKTAQYKAPPATIYELAKLAASDDYKIGDETPSMYTFITAAQFYSREGGRESPGADGIVQTSTFGSVRVQLIVQVVDVDHHAVVTVTPKVYETVTGSPQLRELKVGDPSIPPWVGGRVDALAIAIYERAKQYIEKP